MVLGGEVAMKCIQLDKNKWECVADAPKDPFTNKRVQIRRRGKTKTIAAKKVELEIQRLELLGSHNRSAGRKSFELVSREWYETYSKQGHKENTLRLRRYSAEVINQLMGQASVDQISTGMLQKIINDLFEQGKSESTLESHLVYIRAVLKHAKRNRYVLENVASEVKLPRRRLTIEDFEESKIEEKYFSSEEVQMILESFVLYPMPLNREMFMLLLFSGMRCSEMLALKWDDILYDKKQIKVTKTIYNPDHTIKGYALTPPKTYTSIRTIDIDDKILRMLKTYHTQYKQNLLIYRKINEEYHDENFVFCRKENGYPYSWRFVQARLDAITHKMKWRRKFSTHLFRHTHVTMLAEAGVDLATIQKRIGHKDGEITRDVYLHITSKMEKKATDALGFHFESILQNAIAGEM